MKSAINLTNKYNIFELNCHLVKYLHEISIILAINYVCI